MWDDWQHPQTETNLQWDKWIPFEILMNLNIHTHLPTFAHSTLSFYWGICWNGWCLLLFFVAWSSTELKQYFNWFGDRSVSFRAFISAAIITADADCVLSACLTIMCLFHSPWSWLLLSSPLLQRNESVCDVGWLLTVCPTTHIGVVLLSQHISIPPPPSVWVVPKPVSKDV